MSAPVGGIAVTIKEREAFELLRALAAGSNRHAFIAMDTVPSDLIDRARAFCEGENADALS